MTHNRPTTGCRARRALLAGLLALAALAAAPLAAPTTALADDYEELVDFAEEHCQGMPDPVAMASLDEPRAYGTAPYWQGDSFYNGDGTLFLADAANVIDVSEHQGVIDWQAVRDSGVDAAIIRVGYGVGNEDRFAARNIAECNRLGIPYGVYLYSYAYDADFARREGEWVAEVCARLGARPTLPYYYDLENWTWTGHTPPTSPKVYEGIVDAFFSAMASRGISDVSVYSYTSYLQGPLNAQSIWRRTSWVAQYNYRLDFSNPYRPSFHGWQYSERGSVPGIRGAVDLNAFTSLRPPESSDPGWYELCGRTYYYDASGRLVRGWAVVDGRRYRLDADDGHRRTGWFTVGGDGSQADASGVIQTGFLTCPDGAVRYYSPSDALMVRGWAVEGGRRYRLDRDDGHLWCGWYTVDGEWYLSDAQGVQQTGFLTCPDGLRCYFDPVCFDRARGWLDLGGNRYFLDPADGHVLTGWFSLEGRDYFAAADGALVRGWHDEGDSRYRLDGSDGHLWRGWYTVDGTWYHSDERGVVTRPRAGWFVDAGRTYWLDPSTGARRQGWLDLGDRRYRLDRDDGHLWCGWYTVDGAWYRADGDGAIVRGWHDEGGRRYRLDRDDGHLWCGWYTVDGIWYASGADGAIWRGWHFDGQDRYRFDPVDGHLLTGWYEADGNCYYAWGDGVAARGWLDLGGRRYRLDRDDCHLWCGWYTVDGVWYYAGPDGAIVRGWLELDGRRYRLDIDDGHLWTGWYTVDGVWHHADENGVVLS